MWDDFLGLLEELAEEDSDFLIDELQELPEIVEQLCKHAWLMELVLTLCKARQRA